MEGKAFPVELAEGLFGLGIYVLRLEMMAVATSPKPNPARSDPTNDSGEAGKKKNPTPRPANRPPPMAHVLLSCLFYAMDSLNSCV